MSGLRTGHALQQLLAGEGFVFVSVFTINGRVFSIPPPPPSSCSPQSEASSLTRTVWSTTQNTWNEYIEKKVISFAFFFWKYKELLQINFKKWSLAEKYNKHVTYVLRETNVNENILNDGFMKNKENVNIKGKHFFFPMWQILEMKDNMQCDCENLRFIPYWWECKSV